jgi:hypothetical protein
MNSLLFSFINQFIIIEYIMYINKLLTNNSLLIIK